MKEIVLESMRHYFSKASIMPFKLDRRKILFNSDVLIWTSCVLIICGGVAGSSQGGLSCHEFNAVLESKKISDKVLEPVNDDHLSVCTKDSKTCCLEKVEKYFAMESRKEYGKVVSGAVNQLSMVFKTRAKRFDSFFKNLLFESKRDFDKMFKKTYGIIYEQNAYVFTDFFEELERYYVKGQVDLEEAMENFFNTLYQKMFTVLNAQYQFDEKYLVCIGDHMKELKPFGDVPQKLSVQIKRSFVATRTFAQALNVAKDILDYMKNLEAAENCHDAFFRMSYCQVCKSKPEIKPCSNLCLNVMRGCLAYQMELEVEWNHFIDALDKVSDRLLGPFNIEVVVEPINIKISEAIMNFQENSHEVSEKVFSGCGRLHLRGRARRETREIELESYEFSKEEVAKPQNSQQQSPLVKLIRDIRQKVKDSKHFWSKLPYHVCNDERLSTISRESSCWNGTAVGRYTKKITVGGLSKQQHNPEVSVDAARPKSILNEQIYNLKVLTNKLKNAYNGFDVDWMDTEDSSSVEMGSGEGSGHNAPDGSGEGVKGFNEIDVDDDDHSPKEKQEETKIHHTPKRPISSNEESNVIPKETDDLLTRGGANVYTSRGSSNLRNRVSLLKAVASYMFPICIIWLGGSISEWL